MGLIASHDQRARNMRTIRSLFQPGGWFVVVCGVVVVVSAVAGGFGADAAIVGAVFVAIGAAMVGLSRRRWRLEDPGYKPRRLVYAAATAAIFAFAAGMFFIAVIDESVRTVFVIAGLYMTAMGVLGVIRTLKGA